MAASIEQIADDLREYLLARYRTQREIARKLEVSPGHISNYLGGKERISHNVADRIHELHPDVSVAYLLTGEGVLCPPAGTVRISQSQRVTGNGTGIQSVGADQALAAENAQLREQLAQANSEKARLLGIIEKLTNTP